MTSFLSSLFRGELASAHCDAPCGVYDGASAEIAARAALNLTKRILELPRPTKEEEQLAYDHSIMRFTLLKEEQVEIAKREILILWTDFFTAEHLKQFPDLHEKIWALAKLCSKVKRTVDLEAATKLHHDVKELGEMHRAASAKA